MKILHYSLGFPPYRSGGLTKFTIDLMKQQQIEKNEVYLLWPGQMLFSNNKTIIKSRGEVDGIFSYEVINPTPVSYDEGITEFSHFMANGDLDIYEKFLLNLNPDIIHIHTLMGLHKNMIIAAKKLNIKILFTAHDYFPICPKITMIKNGGLCEYVSTCSHCPQCNNTALSLFKIKLLQSPLYRHLKDSMLVKKLRKNHRDSYLSQNTLDSGFESNEITSSNYMNLRFFYKDMLLLMDCIHYNSSVTKTIYEKYLGTFNSVIIPITHSNVNNNKKLRYYNNNLRLTYLGPYSSAKGFFRLIEALDQMKTNHNNFCLNVYFEKENLPAYIKTHKPYKYDELPRIFNETDVVVVPSICFETFGYTALEALSFGVPIVISSRVGAKDIITNEMGIIYPAESTNELTNILEKLTPERLSLMNKNIYYNFNVLTLKEMCRRISHLYKKMINDYVE